MTVGADLSANAVAQAPHGGMSNFFADRSAPTACGQDQKLRGQTSLQRMVCFLDQQRDIPAFALLPGGRRR
jgi:hypothetical protein